MENVPELFPSNRRYGVSNGEMNGEIRRHYKTSQGGHDPFFMRNNTTDIWLILFCRMRLPSVTGVHNKRRSQDAVISQFLCPCNASLHRE
jgi:hypothetical protein